jgi:hypothetical protein
MFPDQPNPTQPPAEPLPAARRWPVLLALVALLLAGGALTTGLLTACWRRGPEDGPASAGSGGGPAAVPATKPLPPHFFRDWPPDNRKPDVAILLTGQQHSHLKFCGCSSPQLGGFERRYNLFAKLAHEKGWPIVAADLGDLVEFKSGEVHDQSILKYETAMRALEILRYTAIALGADDFNLPLEKGIAEFTLQKPDAYPRVLAANLSEKTRMQKYPLDEKRSLIGSWQAAGGNGMPVVGFVGLTGVNAINDIQDKTHTFDPSEQVIKNALAAMDAAKVELKVLLYQGAYLNAKDIAQKHFPNKFDIILCQSNEDTPPAEVDTFGRTMVVRVGNKGFFVGVVGAYRTGKPEKPFELYYQLIPLGEELETDKDKEKGHPILALLDDYAKMVHERNFLATVASAKKPIPVPPGLDNVSLTFVGSQTCFNCHKAESAKWSSSKHSHAFDALTKVADKPKLRQFDPECVVCHVSGLGFKSGFVNPAKTGNLLHVGCENCHGPGSAHVALPKNTQFQLAMSPWKAKADDYLPDIATLKKGYDALSEQQKKILRRVDDMCQKCHDQENDSHFRFEKNWPEVIHGRNAPK